MSKKLLILVSIVLLLLVGCDTEKPTPTPDEIPTPPTEIIEQPTAEPTPPVEIPPIVEEGVFISELLAGVPGGNNQEFIELYNAGSEAVDLAGWSLWYLLGEGQAETLVYQWVGRSDIPPHGHFLLIRAERDFGVIADGLFDVAVSEFKGGLVLRNSDDVVMDALGWGPDAPADYTAGTPADAPEPGSSLVRLPGGERGNSQNSGDNAADFAPSANPDPQNSGSPAQPPLGSTLTVRMLLPEAVEPGTTFDYTAEVTNLSDTAATDVVVVVPIPAGFTVEGGSGSNVLELPVGDVPGGGAVTASVVLAAPFTYSENVVRGYYVQTADGTQVYGGPQLLTVAGGAIPIATARELIGSVVTVEGVATMYTGGFFAGSTSVKFYIQDETGGIQVFADGGAGIVEVDVGDRVRVTGRIEPFRDSLELIPGDPSADVEIIGSEEPPEPMPIAIPDNESDDGLLGRLNVIEGVATSIVEMSFDYQVELADAQGNSTLVLIEKDTGVTAEPLDVGQTYRIVGISEFYQGERQVKPRYQSDIVQVFPPILRLELSGKNNALPGDTLPYTITVYNHTAAPMTNVRLVVPLPTGGAAPVEVLDGGQIVGERIVWELAELAADGGAATVHFTAVMNEDSGGIVQFGPLNATADQWPEPAVTEPYLTFAGSGVPIWAIQGSGPASPYSRSRATTEGVVTAVFPDLNGFWIQDLEGDGDPATSDGLFVLIDNLNIEVAPGQLVQVNGRVRELFTQTTLHVESGEDVVVLGDVEPPYPAAVVIDPPQDNEAAELYKESLEGMLVTLGEPAVVVAPTTHFGEYVLVYERWGVEHVARTEQTGFFIMVDDGSTVAHNSQETLPYVVANGDIVTNLVGPLAFSFGHYKIEALGPPEIEVGERPLPSLPLDGPETFSVATFNVENLFDLIDPHPSSPPRPTLDEYRLKLTKIAAAIVAMGAPDIIGLQEVENIDILEALVEEGQIAEFGYVPYLIEGDDSRGIDVAYLVRSEQVTVQGVGSYPGPDSLTVRHPLVMTATVHLESGDRTVYLFNNHFLALSAGEEVTEPTRNAQAAWNATLVERFRAGDPEAAFIVMGDLNSFYNTLPIETLQAAELHHVYEFLPQDQPLPYTYIFEGVTQTLDHILLSEDLFTGLLSVQALHIGADYPIWNLNDSTAQHLSDHDPVVVVIGFE
jgi:uncharacterized repeat protein (TIGR01451 family)